MDEMTHIAYNNETEENKQMLNSTLDKLKDTKETTIIIIQNNKIDVMGIRSCPYYIVASLTLLKAKIDKMIDEVSKR